MFDLLVETTKTKLIENNSQADVVKVEIVFKGWLLVYTLDILRQQIAWCVD